MVTANSLSRLAGWKRRQVRSLDWPRAAPWSSTHSTSCRRRRPSTHLT